MEMIGLKTRDGFLYCLPKDMATKGSSVVRDMVEAQDAIYGAPPPTHSVTQAGGSTPAIDDAPAAQESGSTSMSDDAPSMIVINVDCTGRSMDCANWCLADKMLYMKYPKEGIPAKLIAAELADNDLLDEATQLAYDMDF